MAHAKSSVPALQSSILPPTITNYFFHSSLISHKSLSPPLQVSLEFGVLKLQKPHFQKRYLDGLGDAVELGLVKAVGVSNYSEKRLHEAHAKLRGIPLASNQVNYSLIYRAPEENGVKSTCDELGITLIANSPIAQGALKGKYTPENPPTGPRRQIYTPEFLSELQSPLNRIKEIGEKYSKTNTQVVLNWLIAQDNVVPIPGAKNVEQAVEFAGALGWRLNSEEVAELRALATEIKPVTALLKNYKFLHEHRGCKFFYTKICTHFTSNANLTYLI